MSKIKDDGGIETYSGRYVYPLNMRSADVTIEDIAHALSNKCRYTGHTREFYSVAQHSVLVSEFVPREIALAGLLHDASEYVLPDVSSPVKPRLKGFKEIEELVLDVIFKKFGILHLRDDAVAQKLIKDADTAVMAIEVRDLMHSDSAYWSWLPPADPDRTVVPAWGPAQAKRAFLYRYRWILESMLSSRDALERV